MNVINITYASVFKKDCERLPRYLSQTIIEKEKLFRENPLHPSLRLHRLRGTMAGLWSISITMNYRIIFKRQNNGDILFISIGTHDIYKNL